MEGKLPLTFQRYFASISTVRGILPKAQSKEGTLLNNFVAGSIGGTLGTILNTPVDVVKTRIQSQMAGMNLYNTIGSLKYNWTIPAIATVFKEEGPKALYKGFVPKVLRLGPGGGVLLVVFDFVSGYIKKNIL
jgi:solute carrier family 25 2-oxodicarboxylate transporter 21